MSKGIDVSNNNGHVDWVAVAGAGYTYAMAKATEGLGFVDAFYEQNRAGAAAHGLHFGAYHFFTPGDDAAAQVAFFLEHAKPRQGDIVPALDYERPPADKAPAEQFVVALHRELGHWPLFYTFLSFVQSMRIPASSPLASCPLWLADFTATKPATPAPWHEITMWQGTSTARVPGIGGPVDVDTGKPPINGPGPIVHYDLRHYDKHGTRHLRHVRMPAHWLELHPLVKTHGRIIIDPVHKK
jgi:lysozyme